MIGSTTKRAPSLSRPGEVLCRDCAHRATRGRKYSLGEGALQRRSVSDESPQVASTRWLWERTVGAGAGGSVFERHLGDGLTTLSRRLHL
jgi:hypothetical protein